MPSPDLLCAAARAFAMTALSDGKIDPLEERRFGSFVAGEPLIRSASRADAQAAWARAVSEVEVATSFEPSLARIRRDATGAEAKQMVMRAAQAAMVADYKLELQEDAAVRALAEALGLDPEGY